MKIFLVLAVLFSMVGCNMDEEDCYNTDEVLYYKTTETEFYTISEPVYRVACNET